MLDESGECVAITDTDVHNFATNCANAMVMAQGKRMLVALRAIERLGADSANSAEMVRLARDAIQGLGGVET